MNIGRYRAATRAFFRAVTGCPRRAASGVFLVLALCSAQAIADSLFIPVPAGSIRSAPAAMIEAACRSVTALLQADSSHAARPETATMGIRN